MSRQGSSSNLEAFALSGIYRCPECASSKLIFTEEECSCDHCAWGSPSFFGIPNLTRSDLLDRERQHYDNVYSTPAAVEPVADLSLLEQHWQSLYYPMNEAVLTAVGQIANKEILLLGNGGSEKELYFLTLQPRRLVFSDLSLQGVRLIRDKFDCDRREAPVEFVGIDALNLPLVDECVDIVYGYSFVHHLDDIDSFLAETYRVLRPGGRCVFMENTYSPLWQASKTTVLRPLMRYFHWRGGISPEDLRVTLTGGHREEDLARKIESLGATPFFQRSSFLHYFFTRASERLPPQPLWRFLVHQEWILRMLIQVDERLASHEVVRRNQIRLVWGFSK